MKKTIAAKAKSIGLAAVALSLIVFCAPTLFCQVSVSAEPPDIVLEQPDDVDSRPLKLTPHRVVLRIICPSS
ncbi:MAG: hypothetical protein AABO57_03695 [Acidobacteriota bacterium]